MSPLKKDRYQQVADLINGLKKKEHEQTEIDIPIRIDSHTTSVRISYHDGPIPEAIGYDFIANRNGKCDFTIKDWNGKISSIQIGNFNWQQFEKMFNLQKLKYEQNGEKSFEGGSFTTIELYNGKSVAVRAEQQTGGISNAGNLVGNVYPLHKYICSIPEVNFLIENIRNQKEQPSKDKDKTNLLKEKSPELGINFIGNIEGRDAFSGKVDAIIADGFTGNIFLKTVEGMGKFIKKSLTESMTKNVFSIIGSVPALPSINRFKKMMDYKEYGGALFLGVKKPVVKAHGSSDEILFEFTIKQAEKFVENRAVPKLIEAVEEINKNKNENNA